MTISRRLASAFAMTVVAAVGFAASAQADPPLLNGTYAVAGGADGFDWTITSRCAATGCTGIVASNKGWTRPATLVNGRWNFTVSKPDGVICTDGHYEPAVISMSIDPVSLGGTISSDSNYGCPGGDISQTPFQLTKVG